MPLQDEALETLGNLGLTVLQAKVYFALAKLGRSTGKTTAKSAKIASQDIYRVLSELQEKGIVEKIIGKPNIYRSISLEEATAMLLKQREKQTVELKKEVFEICKNFTDTDGKEEHIETNEFILVPGRGAIKNKVKKMIRSAEKKIDLMSDFENAMRGHAGTFDLELSMIERGVKIREILSKPKREYTLPSYFLALQKKKPAYEVKFLSFPPTATALIMDNQEILMSTIPETSLLNQPFLSTTNPVLVRTFQQFYDMLWKSSK